MAGRFLPNRGLRSAGTAYCSSGLCQHRCHSPTASPVARPASALAWNPTAGPPGARARSRRLHRGTAHSLHCWLALLTAAPHHCGPPGPVVSPVAVLQPLWLRDSTTEPPCVLQLRTATAYCDQLLQLRTSAWQFVSAGPCGPSGYERNHNHVAHQCLLQTSQIFASSTARKSASNSGRRRTGADRVSRGGLCRSSGAMPVPASRGMPGGGRCPGCRPGRSPVPSGPPGRSRRRGPPPGVGCRLGRRRSP